MANLSNINNKFLVTTGGNVGIGNTNPNFRLHVTDTQTSDTAKLQLRLEGNAGNYYDLGRNFQTGFFEIQGNQTGYNNIILAPDSGNVGIGTSPSATLDVQGTSALFITRTSGGLATYIENDGGYPFLAMYQIGAGARVLINTNGNSYFNGGNVGIGVIPAAHYGGYEVLDIGNTLSLISNNTSTNVSILTNNAYLNSGATAWVRKVADEATMYEQVSGEHRFSNAGSAAAGVAISWTERMRIDSSGNVGIGIAPVSGARLTLGTGSGANEILSFAPATGGNAEIRNTSSTGTFTFTNADGSSEKMRIASNGRVGINTTNPLELLNVHQTTATAGLYMPISIAGSRYQADYAVGIAFRPENNSGAYAAKTALVGSGGGYGYNMADLHFCFNNSTTITDEVTLSDSKVTMKRSGNVGIGTISPSTALDVRGGSGSGSFDHATFTSVTNRGLKISTANSSEGQNGAAVIYNAQDGENYGSHAFQINGSTKMFIKGNNVGIGTESPAQLLQINGAVYATLGLYSDHSYSGNRNWRFITNGFGSAAWGGLALRTSTGAGLAPDTTRFGIDYLGNVGIGIGEASPSAKLEVGGSGKFQPGIADGDALVTIAQTNTNAYVHAGLKINAGNTNPFYIYQSGSSNTLRFNYNSLSDAGGQMVITDGGNVGIATASPNNKLEVTTSASQYTGRFDYTGSSGGAYGCLKLRISANTSPSFIDLFYDGFSTNPLSPVGAIVTTGSAVLYSSFSDYRLKENIADLTGALDRVNSLQPKTFNYINRPEATNEGFLAHELQEIVPQAVSGTKDGVDEDGNPKYQGVDNAHLVPLLVGAIKELKAEIELLKNK